MALINDILRRYGGTPVNDLNVILDQSDGENDELSNFSLSPYVNINGLKNFIKTNNEFSIMPFNIQSLNTKHSELMALLFELNYPNHKFSDQPS